MRRAMKEGDDLSISFDAAKFRAAPDADMTAASDQSQGDALLRRILGSLDDDKAEDVVTIDLSGKSQMADYMVVCSGRSSRQVTAMAEKLVDRLKQDFGVLSLSLIHI